MVEPDLRYFCAKAAVIFGYPLRDSSIRKPGEGRQKFGLDEIDEGSDSRAVDEVHGLAMVHEVEIAIGARATGDVL